MAKLISKKWTNREEQNNNLFLGICSCLSYHLIIIIAIVRRHCLGKKDNSAFWEIWTFYKWNVGQIIAQALFTSSQLHPWIQWLEAKSHFFFVISQRWFIWKWHFGVYLVLLLHKNIYDNTIKRRFFFSAQWLLQLLNIVLEISS